MTERSELEKLKADIVQETEVVPMLEAVGRRLGAALNAKAVFGPAVERGNVTVIPVAKATWGFGAGGGSNPDDPGSGGGGGGGGPAQPIGYIEVSDTGAAFHRIEDPLRRAAGAALSALAAGAVIALRTRRRG